MQLSLLGGGCADPSLADQWGRITVEGSLVVSGAVIQNTNVDVSLAGFEGGALIANNNIALLESSAGFGGEFFVEGSSVVQCNAITSYGDRYLDLDPDPTAEPRPLVQDNRIEVIITQGTGTDQGELLELRTQDVDCDPAVDPDGCPSGAFELAVSPGYSDTWTLEKLTINAGARLNLTNRPGFVFQDPNINSSRT